MNWKQIIEKSTVAVLLMAMPCHADASFSRNSRFSVSETAPFTFSPLTDSEQAEWKAWSCYAQSMFSGFMQLDTKSEEEPLKTYLQGIHDAFLINPHSAALREKWLDSHPVDKDTSPETIKRYSEAFRDIYNRFPAHVDNALIYLSFLGMRNDEEGERLFKEIVQSFQNKEGRVLGEYIIHYASSLDSLNQEKREDILLEDNALEKDIDSWDKNTSMHDRWAFLAAAASIWSIHYQILDEKLRDATPEFSKKLMTVMTRLRLKTQDALKDFDFAPIDPITAKLLKVSYTVFSDWQSLARLLKHYENTEEEHTTWWLNACLDITKNQRDLTLLNSFLERYDDLHSLELSYLKKVQESLMTFTGQQDRVLEIQEIIVEKSPQDNAAKMRLAALLLHDNQPEKAWETIQHLDASKMNLNGRILRNTIMLKAGKAEEAYMDCFMITSAHQLGQGYHKLTSEFHYQYSLVCLELHKTDEAIEQARLCYEKAPNSAVRCNFYSYLLAEANTKLPLAEKLVRKALRKSPQNVAYLDTLAWVQYRQKQYTQALETMELLLKQDDTLQQDPEGEIASHIADICEALDMPLMARFYRHQACDANPALTKKYADKLKP